MIRHYYLAFINYFINLSVSLLNLIARWCSHSFASDFFGNATKIDLLRFYGIFAALVYLVRHFPNLKIVQDCQQLLLHSSPWPVIAKELSHSIVARPFCLFPLLSFSLKMLCVLLKSTFFSTYYSFVYLNIISISVVFSFSTPSEPFRQMKRASQIAITMTNDQIHQFKSLQIGPTMPCTPSWSVLILFHIPLLNLKFHLPDNCYFMEQTYERDTTILISSCLSYISSQSVLVTSISYVQTTTSFSNFLPWVTLGPFLLGEHWIKNTLHISLSFH